MKQYVQLYQSPIGTLALVSDGVFLTNLYIGKNLAEHLPETPQVFQVAVQWLDDYFSDRTPAPCQIPIRTSGTFFQEEVWTLLRQIPYGQSTTYGELAECIAKIRGIRKMSPQAIGQAVSANPLPIIVPCHRVLASGSRLGGYAYGEEIKKALLHLEQVSYKL